MESITEAPTYCNMAEMTNNELLWFIVRRALSNPDVPDKYKERITKEFGSYLIELCERPICTEGLIDLSDIQESKQVRIICPDLNPKDFNLNQKVKVIIENERT